MLIVAQPKSASTSLLTSLREVTNLTDSIQQFEIGHSDIRDVMEAPAEFGTLRGRHKDVANYSSELLESWIESEVFYKQHVVPTDHNLSLLRDQKFVILLRAPSTESYHAYLRPGANPVGERLQYALEHRENLIQELELFYQRYSKFDGNVLKIDFYQLVKDPREIVQSILDFFGLKIQVPPAFELARERYSGYFSQTQTMPKKMPVS